MNFLRFFFIFSFLINSLIAYEPYDYYLLQLTWAPTFCSGNRNKCIDKPNDQFVIHGNWPNGFNKRQINFCESNENNFQVLRPISQKLSQAWPDLKRNDHFRFWRYEWIKHGSCATDTPKLFGIRNFFQTTLEIYHKLNLDYVLGNRTTFHPTDGPTPYSSKLFYDFLSNYYGAEPNVKCTVSKNGFTYLQNVAFCFNKELDLINCENGLQCTDEFLFPTSFAF